MISCYAPTVRRLPAGPAETRPGKFDYYLFKYAAHERPSDRIPEMKGDELKLSGTRQDFDTTTGEPIVLMQFTGKGNDKFEDITRELAQRGNAQLQRQNPFQHFAIVLDNEIRSWPQIDYNELPNGISGSAAARRSPAWPS